MHDPNDRELQYLGLNPMDAPDVEVEWPEGSGTWWPGEVRAWSQRVSGWHATVGFTEQTNGQRGRRLEEFPEGRYRLSEPPA